MNTDTDTALRDLLKLIDEQQNFMDLSDQMEVLADLLEIYVYYGIKQYDDKRIREITGLVAHMIKFFSKLSEAYEKVNYRFDEN